MLTFLRNMRKGFLETDRIRKYILYAVGEIFLVMIGILLALQVNNWNEQRKYRTLEKEILREINQEFKSNLQELEGTLARYEIVRQNLNAVIQSFPINVETNDLDTLASQLAKVHFRGNYDGTEISISRLKNYTSFDIISNSELQSLLMQWEFLDADYRYDEERSLAFHRERFDPVISTKIPRPYSTGLRDPRTDLNYLEGLEFEGLIKMKKLQVDNLFRTLNEEPNIIEVMQRIIELSGND